jgi:hypothetical protein
MEYREGRKQERKKEKDRRNIEKEKTRNKEIREREEI